VTTKDSQYILYRACNLQDPRTVRDRCKWVDADSSIGIVLLVGFTPIHKQAEAYAAIFPQAEAYVGIKDGFTSVCLFATCVTVVGSVKVVV